MTDTATIKKIIDERNANLMKWYAEGSADKVAEVFSEDCWQMPPNSEPLVGREALRESWRQTLGWGKCDFSLEAQDVVVSDFIAVERGKYVFRFSAGPGAPD